MLSHILLRNLHRRHRHMVDLMSPDPRVADLIRLIPFARHHRAQDPVIQERRALQFVALGSGPIYEWGLGSH